MNIRSLYISLIRIAVTALAAAVVQQVRAFDLSVYAESSALASGRWVKISVDRTGLYMLSAAELRRMGFSDMSRVRIHGYGGRRIDDVMTAASYVDDLPQAPQKITDAGIVFYAVGPDVWERTASTANYHQELSPYTTAGYYFVTEGEPAPEITATTAVSGRGTEEAATTVQGRVQHEQDLVMATEAGPLMVGEDFRYTPRRSFTMQMPGRVAGTQLWLECQFVARHTGTTSLLTFTFNGSEVPLVSTDRITATSDSHYVHASLATTRHTFIPAEGQSPEVAKIDIAHSSQGVIHKANLDYITLNYTRSLEMPQAGVIEFWANARALSLGGMTDNVVVWDVTDPGNVAVVNTEIAGGRLEWRPSSVTMRSYVAWRSGATLPSPAIVGTVAAQNLHATGGDIDMVVIAPRSLMKQGERIADLHRGHDGFKVEVVDVETIYNEFSSGCADVSGLRKYLKMLYDRGNGSGTPLRYVLLLGRTTLDNRMLCSTTRALGYATLPAWVNRQPRQSMNDNDGLSTDDFIAMLGDGSGRDMGLDDLSVAVGRIPMTSDSDGAPIVDKLYQYVNSSRRANWKNRIMVLADDEDQGVHLRQAEAMVKNFLATPQQQHIISKVYLDAYLRSSGAYPEARRDMFRNLDEGTAWWFFTGHANNHSWTGDNQLTYTDLNNLYLRNIPFVMASTCDFLRWDSETTSGGEIMYKERYGGAIGMVSATRPVYISDNGYYLEALGRALLKRDDDGRLLTAGEVYRRSKNDILDSRGNHTSNSNRLRFVFMGDPAMRVVTPDNIVEVLTIDGREVRLEDQVTIAAMSNATITGRVTSPDGTLLSDFNGVVYLDIYDALTSVTTHGNGNGRVEVFDRDGDKIYAGSAVVRDGLFTLRVAMPQTVADNFRPATMSLYASAGDDGSGAEAVGACRDFYVFGFEEPDTPDTVPPSIDSMHLNHSGFRSGDIVNSSPVLMASVSDNIGINLSNAGVGFQMTVTIDGANSLADVSSYFIPSSDGSPSGTINYPLENIAAGAHTLRLRVFDTSGNHADREINFLVDDNVPPQIFDVYTDACPAIDKANFYVTYDRPEAIVNIRVSVYDLLGHEVWSGSTTGLSSTNTSEPVTWDLTDNAGRRVNRGIYIFRASISTDNTNYESASRRIAVAAQ